jgi:Family of unknown function (DUF6521)
MSSDTEGMSSTEFPRQRFPFPEAAALFNPALGSIIIRSAASGHEEESGLGLPWLASFLVMPFALHDPTRISLPQNTRTSMATWISRNPAIADSFARNAAALAPSTRRAIRFSLHSGTVNLESSRLSPAGRLRGLSGSKGLELRIYVAAARLAGRWIARTDVLTAYNLLGVKV